ncbi:MAG: hypothetical protein ACOZCL_17890 [Bacillota bacterium]
MTTYRYENNGVSAKTNSSGELTFTVQIPMDLTPENNYIQIWTEGFTAGTEADAIGYFTLNMGTTTPRPSITDIAPAEIMAGSTVEVTGVNFGKEKVKSF